MKSGHSRVISILINALTLCFICGCNHWAYFPKKFERIKDLTSRTRGEIDNSKEITDIKKLVLTINNLSSESAPVYIALYSTKNTFLSKSDKYKAYKFVSSGKTLSANIDKLDFGEYAMAGFQDINNDGICNQNFLGIPTEPYGFSNNVKPTLRAPTFKECKFTYELTKNIASVTMIK